MSTLALVFGSILAVLGIGFFVGTGSASYTALFPTAFGILFIVCGLLARNPNLRKHAMHGAAFFALLGVLAPLGRAIPAVLNGKPISAAIIEMGIMAGVCAVFLVMCVRSFIAARKARQAEAAR